MKITQIKNYAQYCLGLYAKEYTIPDKVKYRFITPKNLDRSYNRNAFNQRFNHLMQIALRKAEEQNQFQDFATQELNK